VGIVKNLYVGANTNIAGTLGVTGVATFSAAPIYSSLTASSAVATDASKGLVSVTNTGTGNNVLATSPTLVTPILGTPTSGSLVNCTDLNYTGFKNRLINSAMVIDQRNAGASGTASSFTVDRWNYVASQASKGTWQQNAGSVTPPVGFKNYLGFTSSSAYSVLAGDYFTFRQSIEGFNTSDLGFGAAGASTVSLSFWVRSSLTGTFGVVLSSGNTSRGYPATYTISAANTWEYKTIAIAGDTSGTWVGATNATGMVVDFGLGVGTTFSATANAWGSGNIIGATGATSVVGTNGATFYITGVQLEKGSTATSFDYRPYGTELLLCQRYYEEQSYQDGNMMLTINQATSTTATFGSFFYKVKKRAAPAVSASGTTIAALNAVAASAGGTIGFSEISEDGTRVNITGATGLVAGNASAVYFSYAKIKMNAEL
jgi:hypothetical protein